MVNAEPEAAERADLVARFAAALDLFADAYGGAVDLRDATDVRLLLRILEDDLMANVEAREDDNAQL
jgi:hypothetical protein